MSGMTAFLEEYTLKLFLNLQEMNVIRNNAEDLQHKFNLLMEFHLFATHL